MPFTEPVDPAGILSAEAKVRIADGLCAEFGVERGLYCIWGLNVGQRPVHGDSRSVPANADRPLAGLVTRSYIGPDPSDAYELVRRAGNRRNS